MSDTEELAALRAEIAELRARLDALIDADSGELRATTMRTEAIDVVEADGTLRMTIHNGARLPAPVINGEEVSREGGPQAGLLFFNDRGDECGGLNWSGNAVDGLVDASSGLMLDGYGTQEVVRLYQQRVGHVLQAGLQVLDNPDKPLSELVPLWNRVKSAAPEDARGEWQRLRDEGLLPTNRVFLGRDRDGSSVLALFDAKGAPRLHLEVTADGEARIHFRDAESNIVRTITASGDETPT